MNSTQIAETLLVMNEGDTPMHVRVMSPTDSDTLFNLLTICQQALGGAESLRLTGATELATIVEGVLNNG